MSKSLFINNLETFTGQAFLRALVREGEELDESQVIMGTYQESTRLDKPRGVKKILKRYKPRLMRKFLLETDVWIYDLNYCDLSDVDFAIACLTWAKELEAEKTVIVISNVMVWANTGKKVKPEVKNEDEDAKDEPPADQDPPESARKSRTHTSVREETPFDEDGNPIRPESILQMEEEKPIEYVPWKEEDYAQRMPSNSYARMKEMEDKFLALKMENLRNIVICSGVLYGCGEQIFYPYFKHAWLQNPLYLPFFHGGENKVPTIHVNDLVKFVLKVSNAPPESPYLMAIDNASNRTQKGYIQAIASGVGSGIVSSVADTELVDEKTKEILQVDIDIYPSPLLVNEENPPDFEWGFEKGIPENVDKILKEFCQTHNLKPMKILIAGSGSTNTTFYAQM
eukprot:TRINITY_DN9879_c0_g1_i1.p1 TRINITY_DN9879_c0_g1~~TRINITY_DN9879_c0_g1_i1.p1  ORF type:complete len:398 (-),score=68.09 TRINITY_DN9879_c0_g1_i1:290-1483(-)